MLTQPILNIGIVIMAHFVFSYVGAFSPAGDVLAANVEATRIAEKWRLGPKDMTAIYEH